MFEAPLTDIPGEGSAGQSLYDSFAKRESLSQGQAFRKQGAEDVRLRRGYRSGASVRDISVEKFCREMQFFLSILRYLYCKTNRTGKEVIL